MAAHLTRKPSTRWLCTVLSFLLCIGLWVMPCTAKAALRGYHANNGYQYLEMGTYPQTLESGLEPILWRILSVDSQQIFLVSEYVLQNRRIHFDDVTYEQNGGAFHTTEMYEYLNGEFLKHFTEDEKNLLLTGDDGALVTLLTKDDLSNPSYGFSDAYAKRGYPTPYALQNGLYQYSNGSSPYWTRTQSASSAYSAVCTKENGNLGYIRVVVQNEGLRPAIYLDAQLLLIQSGSGSFFSPFRVALQDDNGAV